MTKITTKINILIFTISVLFAGLGLQAQSCNADWDALHKKILSQKYEYLKKELNLSDVQMRKFWDVYLRYDKEIISCHEQATKYQCSLTNTEFMSCKKTDEEQLSNEVATKLIEQCNKTERALLEIKERYSKEFTNVLPAQKVLKLNRLEKQFMRKIMNKETERNNNSQTKR